MNIFVLNEDPIIAAKEQCDKHVVKMILESAQMLSSAHRLLDGDDNVDPTLYRTTHKNHPCTVWVRKTSANYAWLFRHFVSLCDEYSYRYGKIHLTDSKLRDVLKFFPENIDNGKQTPFALAMDVKIDPSDAVKSYRHYYKTKQEKFKMVWTRRNVPSWFKE